MGVMLVGSPGRTPFAGYFRGRSGTAAQGLAWAGRLRPAEAPDAAWNAAQSAYAAVAGVAAGERFAVVNAVWEALRPLDRDDISLLVVAWDADGTTVSACGLAELRGDGDPVVPAGHPLLGDPGIPGRTGFFHPDTVPRDWVGVPSGARWPEGDLRRACGWHA